MKTPGKSSSDSKETNKKMNPAKPGSDPDQTPTRETNKPPVAKPNKQGKSGKIGY